MQRLFTKLMKNFLVVYCNINIIAFSALTLLVGRQEGIRPVKKYGEDGGGGHWLVRMEWRLAGWSVCLPLLIFPCTIKSKVLLWHRLTRVVPEMAVKRLWCVCGVLQYKPACLINFDKLRHKMLKRRSVVVFLV